MIVLNVDVNIITVEQNETITSGSVNANRILFNFSDNWADLTKIVSFKADTATDTLTLDDDNMCYIPRGVLAESGVDLFVGVKGVRGLDTPDPDDDVVLPTIWKRLGTIMKGSGGSTPAPDPDIYERIVTELEKLEKDKQDKLTGNEGQIVGFDADGNAMAVDMPAISGYEMQAVIPTTGNVAAYQLTDTSTSEASGEIIEIPDQSYDDTEIKADVTAAAEAATEAKTTADAASEAAAEAKGMAEAAAEAVATKQDRLTAGSGIIITGNVISATGSGGESYDDTEIRQELAAVKATAESKQDALTAGENITIENNVISAASYDDTEIRQALAAVIAAAESKQDALTAGENITIENNVISAASYDDTGVKSAIAQLQETLSKVNITAEFAEITGGHRLTITDSEGTKSIDILDGQSLSVTVNEIEGGHRLTINEEAGSQSFDILDGKDGASYDDTELRQEIVDIQVDVAALDADKQNKITGTSGQFVGFDSEGNPEAQTIPAGSEYTIIKDTDPGDNVAVYHLKDTNTDENIGEAVIIPDQSYDDTALKADIAAAAATAGEAKTTAEAASTTATEAKTTAEAASTTATEANTAAVEAKTIAEAASTIAEAASVTAIEAKTTAEAASTTATEAKTTAEAASATATAASTTATAANTAAAAAQATADGKQDPMSAGDGISITDNVISATGASMIVRDATSDSTAEGMTILTVSAGSESFASIDFYNYTWEDAGHISINSILAKPAEYKYIPESMLIKYPAINAGAFTTGAYNHDVTVTTGRKLFTLSYITDLRANAAVNYAGGHIYKDAYVSIDGVNYVPAVYDCYISSQMGPNMLDEYISVEIDIIANNSKDFVISEGDEVTWRFTEYPKHVETSPGYITVASVDDLPADADDGTLAIVTG